MNLAVDAAGLRQCSLAPNLHRRSYAEGQSEDLETIIDQ